jgi:hypothetical protein
MALLYTASDFRLLKEGAKRNNVENDAMGWPYDIHPRLHHIDDVYTNIYSELTNLQTQIDEGGGGGGGGGGGITALIEDTTPELGGNLNLGLFTILTSGNNNINITPGGTGVVFLNGLGYPTADGTSGQVMYTDGAGNIAFKTITEPTGNELENVIEDLTPQLGGTLDVNGNIIASVDATGVRIRSTTGGPVNISTTGTGTDVNISAIGNVTIEGLIYPAVDGTLNQILKTNGAGTLGWVTIWKELLEDLTPQLGGSLDVNGQSIVSVSNGDIPITPNGTGKVILDGLNWPTADGSADQVLKTDGAGNLSFATPASSSVAKWSFSNSHYVTAFGTRLYYGSGTGGLNYQVLTSYSDPHTSVNAQAAYEGGIHVPQTINNLSFKVDFHTDKSAVDVTFKLMKMTRPTTGTATTAPVTATVIASGTVTVASSGTMVQLDVTSANSCSAGEVLLFGVTSSVTSNLIEYSYVIYGDPA